MTMRAGDRLQLVASALDDDGAAVADVEGAALHIAGALPGERVEAAVVHVSPHRRDGRLEAWADLARLDVASADRVAPVCPGYGRCGGCVLQHWRYDAQVAWKGERVAALIHAQPALAAVPVATCVASPRPLGYRNQGKYVVGRDERGAVVLGGYAPRSHALIDLLGCQIVEPAVDEAARALRDLLDERGVPPFDERTRTGVVRYAIVRANAAGDVLIALVVPRSFSDGETLAAELVRRCPRITGVVENVNATAGNVLFGDQDRVLHGRPTLEDTLGPVRVELGARSFFQVNRSVAALAYEAVQDAARAAAPAHRAVDAYAGAGGFAFLLAPLAGEAIAIEENAAATAAAAAFAARVGAGNVRFVTGDVAAHLGAVGSADVVVLNPPRKGCAPAVLDATARLAPRLVAYLSCNPATLARDLAALAARGLRTRSVAPFDMLPHTAHVEALAFLTP